MNHNYFKTLTSFCLTSLMIGVISIMPPVAMAQTKTSPSPSPSTQPATESAASPSATTQKLRERIEKIVEEKRDQIKGVLDEFDQKKRGTLGNVTRVSEESVTIKTRKATEIIPLSPDVAIEKAGKTIKLDEIAVGDWVVVMGLIEEDAFVPKRLLVSSTSLRPPTPVVVLGTIEASERNQISIIPRSGEGASTVTTTTKTVYQDINGQEIERADIKKDMQALLIGSENDKNEKTARLIRVLTVVESDKP
jgi:hypothetical protein